MRSQQQHFDTRHGEHVAEIICGRAARNRNLEIGSGRDTRFRLQVDPNRADFVGWNTGRGEMEQIRAPISVEVDDLGRERSPGTLNLDDVERSLGGLQS